MRIIEIFKNVIQVAVVAGFAMTAAGAAAQDIKVGGKDISSPSGLTELFENSMISRG